MIYELLLAIGAIGFVAQTLLGFSHGGAGGARGHGSAGGRVGGGRGPAGSATVSPAVGGNVANVHTGTSASAAGAQPGVGPQIHGHGHVYANAHGHLHLHLDSQSLARQAVNLIWAALSPLTLFSICFGAGAAGAAAQMLHERPWVTFAIAVIGGLVLYALLIRPLTNLLFRFASLPAETLAGAVASEAIAASRFDTKGRGVVRLTVDGQTVRLLAYLESEDRERAKRIVAGDKLLVVSVDTRRNSCQVMPL